MGGVSQGHYESLNLARHVADDNDAVTHNRQLLRTTLALPNEPIWLEQVHGVEVIELRDSSLSKPPVADGIITQIPGQVLSIMTADCMPLLLCNAQGTEIAAVHGGWRSLAAGIIEKTVSHMQSPAKELIAWSGPCIAQNAFEVGQEVAQRLGGSDRVYKPSPNNKSKLLADLPQLVTERLSNLGVERYSHCGLCTYQDQTRFFSYRHNRHLHKQDCGRMVSLVWIDAQ